MAQDNWPTLAEAAAVEGVSTEALRKRITRGQLEAVKVEGRWRVNPDSLTRHVRTDGQTRPDTSGAESETATILRDLVEAQRQHIETLTAELAQVHHEVRALHQHLDRLTRALPKPEDEQPKRRRWWPF